MWYMVAINQLLCLQVFMYFTALCSLGRRAKFFPLKEDWNIRNGTRMANDGED